MARSNKNNNNKKRKIASEAGDDDDDPNRQEALAELYASEDDEDDPLLNDTTIGLSQNSNNTNTNNSPAAGSTTSSCCASSTKSSSPPLSPTAAIVAATGAAKSNSTPPENNNTKRRSKEGLSVKQIQKAHMRAKHAAKASSLKITELSQFRWVTTKSSCLPGVIADESDKIPGEKGQPGKLEVIFQGAIHGYNFDRTYETDKNLVPYYHTGELEKKKKPGRKAKRRMSRPRQTKSMVEAEQQQASHQEQDDGTNNEEGTAAAAHASSAKCDDENEENSNNKNNNNINDKESEEQDQEDGSSPLQWARCSKCSKRRLIIMDGDEGTTEKPIDDNWDCSMNLSDPYTASCDVPQRSESWYRQLYALPAQQEEKDNDHNDASSPSPYHLTWSMHYIQEYKKYLRRIKGKGFAGDKDVELKLLVEVLFLQYLLDKNIENLKNPSAHNQKDDDDEVAEEEEEEEEDQEEGEELLRSQQQSSSPSPPMPAASAKPAFNPLCLPDFNVGKNKRPLRAGDIITFCNPHRTASRENFCTAMVLEVHKGDDIAIKTHNGAMIPTDHQVRLDAKYSKKTGKLKREENASFRDVSDYKLDESANGEFDDKRTNKLDYGEFMKVGNNLVNEAVKVAFNSDDKPPSPAAAKSQAKRKASDDEPSCQATAKSRTEGKTSDDDKPTKPAAKSRTKRKASDKKPSSQATESLTERNVTSQAATSQAKREDGAGKPTNQVTKGRTKRKASNAKPSIQLTTRSTREMGRGKRNRKQKALLDL